MMAKHGTSWLAVAVGLFAGVSCTALAVGAPPAQTVDPTAKKRIHDHRRGLQYRDR